VGFFFNMRKLGWYSMTRRLFGNRLVLVASVLILANGCSSGTKPAGTVMGKVTYAGQPLNVGSINLISSAGGAAQAKIGDGGTFKIEGTLDAGEYKAYLSSPKPEPVAPGTKPKATDKFDVVAKCLDPNTSGAKVTVKSGENNVTIEFTK